MSQDQAVAAPSRTSTFRNELNDAVGLTKGDFMAKTYQVHELKK